MATRLYGLIWKWHFAMGLIACPIVAIIALTGAIYTFEPELKRWADSDVMVVEPVGAPKSLDELTAIVRETCEPTSLWIPGPPDLATAFYCKDKVVFVDPYRGVVLGSPDSFMQTVIDVSFSLHWELMLGEKGRLVIEWGTSWTVLLLISGVILWWPRGKRRSGGVLYPRANLSGRQWLRDLHAVFGAYALPVVLAVAATGLMWTVYAGDARWNKVAGEGEHEHPKTKVVKGAQRVGLDEVMTAAKLDRDNPERSIDLGILGPKDKPEEAYWFYIRHTDHSAPTMIESGLVDAYSGNEIHREGWNDRHGALGKIDQARYSIHVGAILGLPGRIAACLASLILAALCITGPWMWWKRRPKGKLGVPPAARSPWWLYVVAAVFGWLLPTVGVTLLALLAFELGRWLVTRTRETTTVT